MPPPAGFVTVTFTVPAVAISAAGIVATIWVLVTDEGVIAGLAAEIHRSTGDETRASKSQCESCSPYRGGGWRERSKRWR